MKIPKTVYIATDYICIPFTEETDCDVYIIPNERLTGEFQGKGIPFEKIESVIKLLYKQDRNGIRVAAVCGSNERLYRRLTKKYGKKSI